MYLKRLAISVTVLATAIMVAGVGTTFADTSYDNLLAKYNKLVHHNHDLQNQIRDLDNKIHDLNITLANRDMRLAQAAVNIQYWIDKEHDRARDNAILRNDIVNLKAKVTDLNIKIGAANSKIIDLQKKTNSHSTMAKEVENLKAKLANATDAIHVKQATVDELSKDKKMLEKHKKRLKAKLANATDAIHVKQATVDELSKDKKMLEKHKKRLKAKLASATDAIDQKQDKIDKLKKDKNKLKNLGDKLKNDLNDKIARIAALEASLASMTANNDAKQAAANLTKMATDNKALKSQIENLKNQIKNLKNDKTSKPATFDPTPVTPGFKPSTALFVFLNDGNGSCIIKDGKYGILHEPMTSGDSVDYAIHQVNKELMTTANVTLYGKPAIKMNFVSACHLGATDFILNEDKTITWVDAYEGYVTHIGGNTNMWNDGATDRTFPHLIWNTVKWPSMSADCSVYGKQSSAPCYTNSMKTGVQYLFAMNHTFTTNPGEFVINAPYRGQTFPHSFTMDHIVTFQ